MREAIPLTTAEANTYKIDHIGQTWPDNRWPTPQEFVNWWDQLGPSDRLKRAAEIIDRGNQAHDCVLMGHQLEIDWLHAEVVRNEKERNLVKEQAKRHVV